MKKLAQKYLRKEIEKKWQQYWENEDVFKFDPDSTKEVYSIDTPPPTVSGRMHIGHAFSFTHMDIIARYQRLKGKNLFYLFGTDDNGLPTERLVEKERKVKSTSMSRHDFINLCNEYLKEETGRFVQDWKDIGISADFSRCYSSIGDHARRISQKSFLDLYKDGRVYQKEAPAIWCPTCQTAIAQVELEDKDLKSTFNDIIFKCEGKDLIIATTRPELLPACVAVFYHPDDKRYQYLENKSAKVPLFNFEVPVLADKRVQIDKGTGLVMCCTFGDQVDMEWQKAFKLPIKEGIDKAGKITKLGGKYEGMLIKEAREAILKDLKEAGLLINQKDIEHTVNVHDRCGTEIEFLTTNQWFIKYLDLKDKFLEAGRELKWYPDHMRSRYENWVEGLQWDWCISRQRFFGVAFPVWYCKQCGEVMLADEKDLPIDPLNSKPSKPCKCGSTEFEAEKDVMDTWATSSLTPMIAQELFKGHKIYDKLFPMSLRPQAQDIITFWLFNTVVKSLLHRNQNPWENAMISGWVLDPKGEKMSKSKGNVVDPRVMMEKHGADAIRYWSACSSLGQNIRFNEDELKQGERVVNKLWNIAKFIEMQLETLPEYEFDLKSFDMTDLEVADIWILDRLKATVKESTDNFDKYAFSRSKEAIDKFFWSDLADNYIEYVKYRLYGDDQKSKLKAINTLVFVFRSVLILYAPIISFATEELYQHYFAEKEGLKSIHLANWLTEDKVRISKEQLENNQDFDSAIAAIDEIRKYKSTQNISLGKELEEYKLNAKVDLAKYGEMIKRVGRVVNLK